MVVKHYKLLMCCLLILFRPSLRSDPVQTSTWHLLIVTPAHICFVLLCGDPDLCDESFWTGKLHIACLHFGLISICCAGEFVTTGDRIQCGK